MPEHLKAVECPKCRQRVEITPRSTAWCSNKHGSALMRPVAKEARRAS